MTDRPIIFSAPMIRALLDGRKTQTRRALKPQPPPFDALFSEAGRWWTGDAETGAVDQVLRVLYTPGDRLWVREAWAHDDPCPVQYRAGPHVADDALGVRWRSPIHMPRAASRLTLTLTEVRVQRLQDITEADAVAEGISSYKSTGPDDDTPAADAFRDLWNDIHGIDAWDANPWVCALTFTVRQGNIDT